jgi:hypothetical protein
MIQANFFRPETVCQEQTQEETRGQNTPSVEYSEIWKMKWRNQESHQ